MARIFFDKEKAVCWIARPAEFYDTYFLNQTIHALVYDAYGKIEPAEESHKLIQKKSLKFTLENLLKTLKRRMFSQSH